ncbi:MAG: hypothetical protein PHO27_03790, partial [Sulfuricurvum sp.]|nr:hypothetical protein [Sulfuricurvum sp.]
MFNEFQQGIIVTIAIVEGIMIFYLMLKRYSDPQVNNRSEKKDISEVITDENAKVIAKTRKESELESFPQIPEQSEIELLLEISTHGKKEGEFVLTSPISEDVLEESTDRRKSDKTISKRSVPGHGKITK